MVPAVGAALSAWRAALAPWDAGRAYLNFVERPAQPSLFFDDDTLRRLRAVKATYDPDDVFRSNHPVAGE